MTPFLAYRLRLLRSAGMKHLRKGVLGALLNGWAYIRAGLQPEWKKALGSSADQNAFSIYWFLVTVSPLLGLPGLSSEHV